MATETGIPAERIRLIPLGIEAFPDFVRPPRAGGPPTVVYLGRLEHRKGTMDLLDAVPRVLRAIPDARFVLIGADRPHAPGGRTHAEYVAGLPVMIRERVTLTGPLPAAEVDRWLQTADLFVAPSRYESFGLIFLEAFIPSMTGPADEGNGWYLGYVYDSARDGSDLVIIDASDFAGDPVARMKLPQRVPFGFHGNWIGA